MRLVVKLEALKTVAQEHLHRQYFTDMHGFLAPIAGKDQKYGKFCFGNLFPIRNQKVEQGKEYSIIISSADPSIIEKIFFSLEIDSLINIGELQFILKDVSLKHQKLMKNSIIESISPVNITTNDNGKIKFHKFDNKGYIKLLENNLLKKYSFLKGVGSKINLFENVTITPNEKHPDSSFQINFFNKKENKNFKVVGSKLVLKFENINDEQLKVFQTLYDSGFGEKTTFGAGFMVE